MDVLPHALSIAVVGFGLVFGTLFVLVLFIKLMKWIDGAWEEREAREKGNALMKRQTVDDTTLILISAAIATYFKGRARIRRVRVLPGAPKRGGVWAGQGRAALQTSHFPKK